VNEFVPHFSGLIFYSNPCHTVFSNLPYNSLIFIPCIIRHSRNDQQYVLIFPLLYSDCRGSVHTGHITTHYMIYTTHSVCISSNSEGSKKIPDDGRLLLKHVGASIQNKGVVEISAYFWSFPLCLIMSMQQTAPASFLGSTVWNISYAVGDNYNHKGSVANKSNVDGICI
jgi:hypothetical protein